MLTIITISPDGPHVFTHEEVFGADIPMPPISAPDPSGYVKSDSNMERNTRSVFGELYISRNIGYGVAPNRSEIRYAHTGNMAPWGRGAPFLYTNASGVWGVP